MYRLPLQRGPPSGIAGQCRTVDLTDYPRMVDEITQRL